MRRLAAAAAARAMSEHRGAITAEGELYPSPRRALDYLELDPPEPGHAVALGDGFLWARIPLPMELNHINVWLLRHEDGWMLVDTGLAEDVCREAWHSLEPNELDGRPLRRIFLTHDHPDHMGLSRWLHQRHAAPVWMSEIGHQSTRRLSRRDARRARRAAAGVPARARHGDRAPMPCASCPAASTASGSAACRRSDRAAARRRRDPCGGPRLAGDRDQRPLPRSPVPV